jgi:hypothetical protein
MKTLEKIIARVGKPYKKVVKQKEQIVTFFGDKIKLEEKNYEYCEIHIDKFIYSADMHKLSNIYGIAGYSVSQGERLVITSQKYMIGKSDIELFEKEVKEIFYQHAKDNTY